MNARESLHWVSNRLRQVAGDLAHREAETILESVLRCKRHELHLASSRAIDDTEQRLVQSIVERRVTGTPLAYVLGRAYFHSCELEVSSDVLIPRPDTETLVEAVLARELSETRLFLDMGTGSGAIAAALLANRPLWRCMASDVSRAAARVAARNLQMRCCVVVADRLAPLRAAALFDFVVSNPPYVSVPELEALDAEVRAHEPRVALDGGPDGLEFYRYLASEAMAVLCPGGAMYLEIGHLQGDAVSLLLRGCGWQQVTVLPDLAGRPRVVCSRSPL